MYVIQNNMEYKIFTFDLERFPGQRIILDGAEIKGLHAITHLQEYELVIQF